jgi:hypothetical protein
MTATTKRAAAAKAAARADEITVEELAEIEAARIAAKRKREAADDERLARRAKEIAAEKNAINGRGQGITVGG